MRAVVYQRYGPPDVLEVREVDEPDLGDRHLLVRVRAASVNRSDWETLRGSPAYVRLSGAGFSKPKKPIVGTDFSGVVEQVGPEVTQFAPGDEVFGDGLYAGVGAFAELLTISASAPVVPKPAGITHEQAAAIPQAAMLALQGLRAKGGVQSAQRVLIVGGGGGGGTFAIQLAKAYGADVTAVDNSGKLDLMRSLGADHVVDYTRERYPQRPDTFHRILDFVGSQSVFANRRLLERDGVYSMVGGGVRRLLGAFVIGGVISKIGNRHLGVLVAQPNKDDLIQLAALVESGRLAPSIERVYPLEAAPDALARLGADEAQGKLVVVP